MKLSAREIAFRVNDQKLSASKFIKNTLDSIRKKNSFLNAFLYLDKNVQKRAEHLDLNRPLPLAGVPVAVKDNITVINMPCTCGSRFLENYIPPFSATAVELLENAGALIIGKTNLDEFAMGSSSEYSAFGKTINPHFPDRVPGGSSGGSASAIAAGLVPVALGSDSGGSIRQPASFCQIFALKPTWGAISRYGLVPLANSLDCIGIMTRYLDDLDLVFNVLNQHDDKDNTSTGKCSEFYEKMPEFVVPDGIESYLSESIRIAWTNFLDLCRKNDLKIRSVKLPDLKKSLSAYMIINMAETAANMERFDGIRFAGCHDPEHSFKKQIRHNRSKFLGKEVKRRIILGNYILAAGHYKKYYRKALAFKDYVAHKMSDTLDKSVIIMPAAPTEPFEFNRMNTLNLYNADILTTPASLSGSPVVTLPILKCKSKHLAGLQLIGKNFSENSLINIGQTLLNLNIDFYKMKY